MKYHLVIVGKPFIPVVADAATLVDYKYVDSSGNFPKGYIERNLLSYYVPRNIAVLKYLQRQKWASNSELVVAGHSEGSTIAVTMARKFRKITHLIYSGGNPAGRILSIVEKSRAHESDTDSTRYGEDEMNYWRDVVANRDDMGTANGDTYKATYEFSVPVLTSLEKLKIPVLVTYGTKDWSAPFNDLLRVEVMRLKKKNFSFKAYVGTEHNFFPVKGDNSPDYSVFNWDKVAMDWLKWLRENGR